MHNGCLQLVQEGITAISQTEARVLRPGEATAGREGKGGEGDEKKHTEEVYTGKLPVVLKLGVAEDPVKDILYSVSQRRCSGQLYAAALSSALRAVHTTYSFVGNSLQRNLQEAYSTYAGTASLGLPRFDLMLELTACRLHMRVCQGLLLLTMGTRHLQVHHLVTLIDVVAGLVTRMLGVIHELQIYDCLAAVKTACVDIDMDSDAYAFHVFVLNGATRICVQLCCTTQSILPKDVDSIRRKLLGWLGESSRLLVSCRGTLEPELQQFTHITQSFIAGE